MRHRHPLPRTWLMTDERLGVALWPALRRLPPGSGVVFRHHATPFAARTVLLEKVLRIARSRRLMVLVAGEDLRGRGIAGRHNAARREGIVSRSVHDMAQARAARRAGADVVFVSPMFPTRSHPGGATLRPARAALLIRMSRASAIALGGMDRGRFARLRGLGFHGWAAIDAWHPRQKRKAVPI